MCPAAAAHSSGGSPRQSTISVALASQPCFTSIRAIFS